MREIVAGCGTRGGVLGDKRRSSREKRKSFGRRGEVPETGGGVLHGEADHVGHVRGERLTLGREARTFEERRVVTVRGITEI